MAKETKPIGDKAATVTVPSRTARVQKLRGTPATIQQTHVVRQEKAR